jgi:2-polyprenyl-3-methyl-5-hydroxy-6-metoxy-1,4-benzoquinol methylase
MPTAVELEAYYREVYRWDYQLVKRGRPSRRHLGRSEREAAGRLEYLNPALHRGARILDFGCGAGAFLGLCSKHGYSVQGIEPGKDYATYAQTTFGIEVINDVWENVKLPAGSFNVITAVEVLEHLRKPVEAMRWLASLLAEDGVIYVTVPDATPPDREALQRFHFAHVHNFTPRTLLWAGLVAGLEPDPRFTPDRTLIAFRKALKAAEPATFRRNHGIGLQADYRNISIPRYLLSGVWLRKHWRQLRRTARESFSA